MTIAEDELAIRSLVATYSDATNRGDLEGMVNVYAPDGELIAFGGPAAIGHDAIRRIVGSTIESYEWIFQMTHSGLVEVEGDIAHGRWWVSEIAHIGGGNASQFYGVYQDKVIRTADGWRFASRRLDATFLGRTTISGKHYSRPAYDQLGDLAS